jgi:hypothetical protein
MKKDFRIGLEVGGVAWPIGELEQADDKLQGAGLDKRTVFVGVSPPCFRQLFWPLVLVSRSALARKYVRIRSLVCRQPARVPIP